MKERPFRYTMTNELRTRLEGVDGIADEVRAGIVARIAAWAGD